MVPLSSCTPESSARKSYDSVDPQASRPSEGEREQALYFQKYSESTCVDCLPLLHIH